MPAYISHAIMGEQLYNELYRSDSLAKIPISINEMRGYSLGNDLSMLSRKVNSDPNNTYTKEFFINIIRYIKANKLTENSSIISLLYGHIAHYFLDTNTHPLIYYIEKGTDSVGPISNHDLIEGYINSYLSKKILEKDIIDINPNYFNQVNLSNPEVIKLLNSIYGLIYQDYRIIKSYKRVISLFGLIETIIKKGKVTKEKLIRLSKFDTYLEQNRLSLREITNEENLTYTNPVTGEKHCESFIELYYKSIDMALDAIIKANKYLYSTSSISILNNVFTGLSYDTGVDCTLGKKMIYVRKKQNLRVIRKYWLYKY